MTLVETLRAHAEICEEIHRLMLEQNRVLKATQAEPGDELLAKNRLALLELEASLERIRAFQGRQELHTAELRAAFDKAQRTILKALLLDRENEQLLLKCAVTKPRAVPSPKPTAGHLARLYARNQ